MLNELKFRQVAGLAGLGASALGLASLASSIYGWRWLGLGLPDRALAATGSELALLFAGLALWLQRHGGHRRLAVVLAGLVVAAVIPGTALRLSGPETNLPALGLLLQSDAALLAAALALFLLTRGRTPFRRPAPIWLAAFVLAVAGGSLFVSALPAAAGLPAAGRSAGTMAAGLLALGVGLVCTQPDHQVVRILASDTAVGALARRLLLALLIVPAGLGALLAILLGRTEFHQSSSVALITIGFILLGLVVILLSAEAAAKLDGARETAVQQELRLAAQLQQQAARLQETVGRRTYELHAAAEANARLALVAKHTTNAVIITDAEGRVEWVNPAFEGLTGYSLQEMIGQKPGPILQGPATNPAAAAELSAALRHGASCSVEILNYTKGGRPYLQLVTIQPVRDAAGHIMNFISIQVDVSALRRDEERNRQLAQRLQLAADSAALGIWEWDAKSQQSTWDERTLAIYGLTAANFHGTTADWERCIHPDDRTRVLARQVIPGGEGEFAQTYRIVRPDGAIRHVESRGVAERAADGRLIRIVGTDRDITAEREAAEQLTRLNERLRRAEELSAESSRLAQVGGWEIDLVTARVTWSGDTWRIHETEEDYLPTLDTFFDFFPPDVRMSIESELQKIRSTGETMDLRVPLITAKGRHRWVRLIGRTDFSAGLPVRTHGAIQDVTASHESNEAQRQLEAQLFQTQKIDTMGTLAGGIAHDFNNLLTGIIGYQELMAETLDPDHPSQAYLAEARNASLRARNLVEQILAFSRQSDHTEHAPLDLQPVIEDAHRFLRSTIPTQIAIETQLDESCGQVQADATQIHQVLMNLGSNAAHAMLPDGGTIKIQLRAVRLQAGRDATLLGVPEGDYARITCSDTGHGMDAATQQRIFDPFFTTKKAGAGTGLGLAVVHGIIRTHHGAISVESTRGVGTTFFIYLPLCGAPVPPNAECEVAPAPRGAGELVCVVDDEAIVGRFTQLALENLGYRVAIFSSAQAALDGLRDECAGWRLLLTDQTMPGMQGHELALAVRQIHPALPITIMSGYFSRIAPQMLAPIGRVELLGKPFTGDELARAVHRALHPSPDEVGAGGISGPAQAPS